MPRPSITSEIESALDERDHEQDQKAEANGPRIELQDSHEQSADEVEHGFESLRRDCLSARGQ